MAYLVGNAGAVTVGTSGGTVSPAWDAGASRTANNLLVLLVGGWGTGATPTHPTGWTTAISQGGTVSSAGIFYAIAAGGDAAPTVSAQASNTWAAQLLEFAGNVTSSPNDRNNGVTGGSSPLALVNVATDAAMGELVLWVVTEGSTVITATMASSPNNGMVAHDTQNNSTSTALHYLFGYGITTGNGAVDTNSVTFDDAAPDSAVGAISSFKTIPGPSQSNLRATMRARRY